MPTDPRMPLTDPELETIYKRVEIAAEELAPNPGVSVTASPGAVRQLSSDALVLAAELRRTRQIIRNRNDGDR